MLAKFKLNITEVSISKTLIDSNISHDEFALINNVLRENDDMKEEINNLETYKLIKSFNVLIKNGILLSEV